MLRRSARPRDQRSSAIAGIAALVRNARIGDFHAAGRFNQGECPLDTGHRSALTGNGCRKTVGLVAADLVVHVDGGRGGGSGYQIRYASAPKKIVRMVSPGQRVRAVGNSRNLLAIGGREAAVSPASIETIGSGRKNHAPLCPGVATRVQSRVKRKSDDSRTMRNPWLSSGTSHQTR